MKPLSFVRYALVALIVVTLSALFAWYLFLKEERASIADVDAGRGVGIPQPFGERAGNTYENIVASFSAPVSGEAESGARALPRLAQAGKTPTAGHGFIDKDGETFLRFVERGTGHVFDISPETGAIARITNTLIPRTYEAIIAGSRVILRGVGDGISAATIIGEIKTSASSPQAPTALAQNRLPDGIRTITINPSGNEMFYIVREGSGASGFRAGIDGAKPKKIFSSAVSGWRAAWSKDGIVLVENAEDGIAGHAYLVRENSLAPLVGNVPGLTLLPHPSSSAYIYGASGGGISLFARLNSAASPFLLPVRTIAEKCAWAPGKNLIAYCAVPQRLPPSDFLGRWYRGEAHTSDQWWRVDISANSAEQLYSSTNVSFDVEAPEVDGGGRYIAFRNALDKTLWLLRIEE